RIGKAIAEIQLCRMAAAFAEIAISLSRNSRLRFSDRLDNHLRLFDQVIEAPAGNGIAACVDDERGFDEIGAETRRSALLSIARAQAPASGSSRRIAISAEVSTITGAIRACRTVDLRDPRIGTAP